MLVRDLQDGMDIDQVLLVRAAERRTRRDGAGYLKVLLADRSGSITALAWEDADELRAACTPGSAVRVTGQVERSARYGLQLQLCGALPVAEDDVVRSELCAGPPQDPQQMEADLRALVDTVQDRWLGELLDRVLGPGTGTWARYYVAPAAKHFHQAYRHGLLEHSLSVAQGVSAMSSTFPGIDRDVAVTGALLHDIGKLEAYTSDPVAIDMTDAGKLLGEIPLGYYFVRRHIEGIDGFPAATAQALLHIILSHHGSLEHGSPVVPCTREATLVHFVDNLGGRLGSFDRLEAALPAGASWSAFDRAIGGGAFFGFASGSGGAESQAAA